MKKKLFLAALMTVLFTCLFAMAISASDFVSCFNATDLSVDGAPDWANTDDTDSKAVFKKSDGEYVRIPAYLVFKGTQFNSDGTNMDYSWAKENLDAEIIGENLVSLEIPSYVTSISGVFSATNYPVLKELVIPTSIKSFPQKFLRGNTVVERIYVKQTRDNEGNVHGITTLPAYFSDQNSVLEYFKMELDYCTAIEQQAFQNSALKAFTVEAPMTKLGSTVFSGCKSLETVSINNTGEILGPSGQVFQSCTNIRSITLNGISIGGYFLQNANGLPGGLTFTATNVGSISREAFKLAVNLSTINISGPIESIGDSIFLSCSNLTSVTITNTSETPAACGRSMCESLKNLQSVELKGVSIGNYAFRDAGGTEDLTINCINVGSIGEYAFAVQSGKSGNIVTVNVSGPIESIGANIFSNNKTVNSAIIRVVGNPFADATSVGGVSSIVLNTEYESNKSDYATGKHIVYGYNLCDLLYNGAHLISEQVYEFASFTEKSYLKNTCTRCQSVLVEEIAPLFVNLGYSASEYDGAQISVNYKVNAQAVVKYEETTGEKLNYGVFAVRADRIGTNDIFGEEGEAFAGVIAADITGSGYTLFNLKITGFTSEQKDIELAMGAYVGTTKEEKTTYSYLQIAAPTNGKYYCASYNDVVELLENKVSAQ